MDDVGLPRATSTVISTQINSPRVASTVVGNGCPSQHPGSPVPAFRGRRDRKRGTCAQVHPHHGAGPSSHAASWGGHSTQALCRRERGAIPLASG